MVKKYATIFLAGLLLMSCPAVSLAKLAPGDFIDIRFHQAEQNIQEVIDHGFMEGMGTNQQGFRIFAPEGLVTRSQAATVLFRSFELDYGEKRFVKTPLASDYYRDVNGQAWYANAVLMCAVNNIFEEAANFYPEQPITRIEMARAVQQCFNAKKISIPMIMVMPFFEDMENLSPEEIQAIAFVNNTGIMKGEGRFFRPADTMSRAELAQVISRCLEAMERQITVDENYNGREYSIKPGQVFVLTLDSNPSTGYQWNFSTPYNEKVLSLTDSYYRAAKTSETALLGQGGKNYWKFKALQEGSTELCLSYSRPWENAAPLQNYSLKVTVAPSAGI